MLLLLRKPLCNMLDMGGPQYASFFQGRHALAHVYRAGHHPQSMFGPKALALGAVSAAAMTPLLNVVNVLGPCRLYRRWPGGCQSSGAVDPQEPFRAVIAGRCGVAGRRPAPALAGVFEVLDITSKGALGLALLAVVRGFALANCVMRNGPWRRRFGLKLLVLAAVHVCLGETVRLDG